MQVWRETGISPEDSKISAPYLQSVQGQDRGYEMQCCYNTLWYCKHAVPKSDKLTGEQITGCSWSIDRQPVVGWKTHQHRIYKAQKGGMIHSYAVVECPEFEEG